MGKLLLVDGNSILNRGFYGLPLLTDPNGIYTNGILGFLNIFLKVLEDEKPDFITVAFDVHAPTFRHKMFSAYKGTRKPMPEELKMQLPIIREVLSAMDIKIVEMAGFEADDLLGTLAKKAEKDGHEVTLLSGDRDLLQIASEHIKISIPKTLGGKTETFHYYASDVVREYGVTPVEFIEVKALQGDTSDNIPGVPKVGPKTATELIAKYHDLEGVYSHLDEITAKALNKNLSENKDLAFLSRDLARIDINAPAEPDYEASVAKGLLNPSSIDVLLKYSLKSVVTKLEKLESGNASEISSSKHEVEFKVIEDFNDTSDVILKMKKAGEFSLYSLGEKGLAVTVSGVNYFIRCYGFVTYDYLLQNIKEAVQDAGRVITYRIKNSYDYLGHFKNTFDDVELMAYLIDPLQGDYPITGLSESYLGNFLGSEKELTGDDEYYACAVAEASFSLAGILREKLVKLEMLSLYSDIEMPLSYVLYDMEKEGVLVDREALREYGADLKKNIEGLEKTIYSEAGTEFNINSPKQLGEILFETLKLPGGKKTKSGYSTAADVLEKLAPDSEIVRNVLEYRALSKLNSTYAEGLQNYIEEDGRIHTHFNQTITATGRISSTEPNLQNIPVRTELGRELRKVFYARPGYVLVDADYSQIELRLMAHMSGDENLLNAYRQGQDIHRSTASLVFKTPFEEVTAEQRRNAKAVNFGIIYGISAFGLSQDIGVPVSEAKKYIEDYFESYPAIRIYLDKTVSDAKENGYTRTLYGRIRPIPELKSSNFMQKSFGERVAMNAPLQGTAADIMKIAMINIHNRLEKENLSSKLLIQVHDEVLIETKNEELDAVMKLVSEEMEKAASLNVDLIAEAHYGSNWLEAK